MARSVSRLSVSLDALHCFGLLIRHGSLFWRGFLSCNGSLSRCGLLLLRGPLSYNVMFAVIGALPKLGFLCLPGTLVFFGILPDVGALMVNEFLNRFWRALRIGLLQQSTRYLSLVCFPIMTRYHLLGI